MTISGELWTSSAPEATGRQLVQLPPSVIDALGNGDLKPARDLSTQALTPYLITDECRSVWRMRSAQIKVDPQEAVWVTRIVVDSDTGAILGLAGYHGKPNLDGMVEVGYAIDPLYRRQGHARAALKILLDVASNDPRVKVVRATVQPDNLPSRKLINHYGFHEVGEQWDEEDGLEVILEISILKNMSCPG
ncbi:N-acetyltransferase domain-containing protein [Fusarium falciforme]|uniref:N-acetyltransferase domain-containing protein n=1 Tax=Fusarium falciforme TaxID=195108 RepID=UPI002301A898|nr:N-acetyltransferase domain-containing protein [Fusarium falciforme]WAO96969.1 N-acetyltransferase domain-containing protein [Fusarium falciforme]